MNAKTALTIWIIIVLRGAQFLRTLHKPIYRPAYKNAKYGLKKAFSRHVVHRSAGNC